MGHIIISPPEKKIRKIERGNTARLRPPKPRSGTLSEEDRAQLFAYIKDLNNERARG